MKILLPVCLILFLAISCREQQGTPKPRAYPRIEYPERSYVEYDSLGCPFTFQYPSYAEIRNKDEECWFDLFMPGFAARLHCSYLPVKNQADFEDYVGDAYDIADRINARANYMEESRLSNNHGVNGLIFEWTGPAASNLHFFLTDTTQHFFKASLYFDSEVKPDSLAPIAAFIKDDIKHLISTFQWKD